MGLTIHYTIEYRGSREDLVSNLLKIRSKCLDLPFEEVGEVERKLISLAAIQAWDDNQYKPGVTAEDKDRAIGKYGLDAWDIIGAMDYNAKVQLRPTGLISLYLWPGEGCESSDVRFYKRVRQSVWRCSSFCKTQYAEHFARCHLLVIKLLDIFKATEGFTVKVSDEGKYWETRDIEVLAESINESTAMIKGVMAALSSKLPEGASIEAPITESENYMAVN